MESYKRWALQFAVSAHKAVTEAASATSPTGGFSKVSLKSYCRDLLLHMSPENELDHTLEYVKNTLLAAFSATKMRIMLVDEATQVVHLKACLL